MTLFAAIFAFVTTFPSPPAQNANQFQASLLYGAGPTATCSTSLCIEGVNITHLAGPIVATGAMVYLKSSENPGVCPFSGGVTVGSGLPAGSSTWALGQVWSEKFSATNWCGSTSGTYYAGEPTPDNVTVDIVSQSNLLFSVILPGQTISVPPTITSTWISPSTPTIGVGYTLYASVTGSLGTHAVYLTGVPGEASGSNKMTYNAASGYWQYVINAGNTTSSGTSTGFVNVTGAAGATAFASITVSIFPTTSGPFDVGVVFAPSPPGAGDTESVEAVVTYTGATLTSCSLSVSFKAISIPYSSGYTYSGSGASATLCSAGSVTVPSTTAWVISSPWNTSLSYKVWANATLGTLGTISGTTTFTPSLISAGKASALVGGTFTVIGLGWSTASHSTVNVTIGTVVVAPTGTSNTTRCTFSGTSITPLTTGPYATGFDCTFTVPSGASAGGGLVASDFTSGQTAVGTYTASSGTFTPFAVTPWTLTASPTSTTTKTGAGKPFALNLTASGFAVGTYVTFSVNGTTITPTTAECFTGATIVGSAVLVPSNGTVYCKIPLGTAGTGTTTYQLTATDVNTGQIASATFTRT